MDSRDMSHLHRTIHTWSLDIHIYGEIVNPELLTNIGRRTILEKPP